MNFRKQAVVCTTLLLLAHMIPLGITRGYAETNGPVDEQAFTAFRSHLPDYVAMSTAVAPIKEAQPVVQEFSFVEKTFQTVTNQPVILRFKSTYPADEVLVRVPKEGQILASHFSDGESITHSHGEYWTLHTEEKKREFTLPIVFETAGQYFITVDHDADHFYLEVAGSSIDNPTRSELLSEQALAVEEDELDDAASLEQESFGEYKTAQEENTLPYVLQPIMAEEKNLRIPDGLLQEEDNRILEQIQAPENRAIRYASNWSQFRSAWNRSDTTQIIFTNSIDLGTSGGLLTSLNTRTASVTLIGSTSTSFGLDTRTQTLKLSGTANFTISNMTLSSQTFNSNIYTIDHSGTGKISFINNSTEMSSASIQARNISIESGSLIYGRVNLTNQGTLEIFSNGGTTRSTGIVRNNSRSSELTTSGTGHNIYIKGNDFLVRDGTTVNGRSWETVDLHLSGISASAINSAITTPDDFSSRYLGLSGSDKTIVLNGRSSAGWVNPPLPSFRLAFQASPNNGGTPTAAATMITQGSTTTIQANPNEKFNFVHWKIVSGTGSSVAEDTSATTTFTMGTADTVVQAVYQKKQGGDITVEYVDNALKELSEPEIISGLIDEEYETKPKEIDGYTLTEVPKNASGRFTEEAQKVTYVYTKDALDPVLPVDPLAPEKEVDPENPPELPEDQGTLSIDFASSFSFGTQGISAQTKRYYAQRQRLLNPDGTVNESEERPNYIQVSDRRPEDERHGWQLAVTQNNQFTDLQENELRGARLMLTNQQFASVQGMGEPMLNNPDGVTLIPGEKTDLLTALDGQGAGTWVYRFGGGETASESVALEVPPTANPRVTTYQTTLTWELSAVPDN